MPKHRFANYLPNPIKLNVYLTMPIRNMIEYVTQKNSLEIMLSNGRLQKEDFDEDQEEALISEGIILQLSERLTE